MTYAKTAWAGASRSMAAALAKADLTVAEIVPGLTITADLKGLEAKLEKGDIDVRVFKVGVQLQGALSTDMGGTELGDAILSTGFGRPAGGLAPHACARRAPRTPQRSRRRGRQRQPRLREQAPQREVAGVAGTPLALLDHRLARHAGARRVTLGESHLRLGDLQRVTREAARVLDAGERLACGLDQAAAEQRADQRRGGAGLERAEVAQCPCLGGGALRVRDRVGQRAARGGDQSGQPHVRAGGDPQPARARLLRGSAVERLGAVVGVGGQERLDEQGEGQLAPVAVGELGADRRALREGADLVRAAALQRPLEGRGRE